MQNDQFNLTGKTAVVTGASRGLGQYMARALARAGADLVVAARSIEPLNELKKDIEAMGRRAAAFELDVQNEESIRRFVEQAEEAMGPIDILVNNAGCNIRKPAADVAWEEWNRVVDTNLRGPFFLAQAVARKMIPRRRGRIINIGSVCCEFGYANMPAYCASKGGLKLLTKALADDWGVYGITVNCLAPGWFKTKQTAALYENEEWVDYLVDRIPLKRVGQPGDLDGMIVFLSSDAAQYVTGQTILVDGGITTGATKVMMKAGGGRPEAGRES
jgi:gluconate 5-dehydrogenase